MVEVRVQRALHAHLRVGELAAAAVVVVAEVEVVQVQVQEQEQVQELAIRQLRQLFYQRIRGELMSARRGKRTVWIVLGLIGIQLGMIFTNCAKTDLKSLAVVESSSAGISNNENIYILSCIPKPAVPVISKITSSDLSESPSKMEHLRSRGGELADIKLSVVIDHECLKNQVSKVFQEIGQETRKNQARGAYTFKVKSQEDFKALEAKLNADPCVLKVDENVVAQVFGDLQPDPLIGQQTHLAAIQQPDVIGSIFNLNNGINSIVRVAVLDTGIDLNHVDLRDRLARRWRSARMRRNGGKGLRWILGFGIWRVARRVVGTAHPT